MTFHQFNMLPLLTSSNQRQETSSSSLEHAGNNLKFFFFNSKSQVFADGNIPFEHKFLPTKKK